jgi:CspA family cold shock protein
MRHARRETARVASGSVKWYNAASGYGYIVPDEGERDLFFHRASLVGDSTTQLREGDRVEFERRDGRMGPKAINVAAVTTSTEWPGGPANEFER